MGYGYGRTTRHNEPRRAGVKQVLDNHMVAHVWAQQTQEFGRSSNGNFYFRGDTIYSYGTHFPIARFVTNAAGERAVLFTTDRNSVTTAQHISDVRGALRGLPVEVWSVAYVEGDAHQQNVDKAREAFDADAAQHARPHVSAWRTLEERLQDIDARASLIWAYCDTFGVPRDPNLNVIAKRARVIAAFERYNDPKAVAKRAKGSANRMLPHYRVAALHHAYVEGATAQHPSEEQWKRLPSHMKREVIGSAWQMPSYLRPMYQRSRISGAQWIAGAGSIRECSQEYPTLVRKQGERLETSRGAEVPFKQAVYAFLRAQECRRTGTPWRANGEQIKVGLFALACIDAEGNITAGCHTLEWSEMLRLALKEVPHLVRAQYPVPALATGNQADRRS